MGSNPVADAIRKKIAALKGNTKKFEPKPGEYKIRFLPFLGQEPDDPIPVVEWYYIDKPIVVPSYFGLEEDPIQEMRTALFASGTEADKKLAKKLFPRKQAYTNIIDRERISEGLLDWRMRPEDAATILAYIIDDEYGDVMDPKVGHDFTLTVSKTKSKFNDTDVLKCEFKASPKPKPLSTDDELSERWMNERKPLKEHVEYGRATIAEIDAALAKWLEKAQREAVEAEKKAKDKAPVSDETRAETTASTAQTGDSRGANSDESEDSSDEKAEPTGDVHALFDKFAKKK